MINRVVLVGRMVKDPELNYTQSGVARTRFTLAINRPFSNQQGEKEADFVQIECWRKVAENVANFTKKGSLVGIEGAIRTGSYEGQDGKRVFFTNVNAESVQFLDSRNSSEGGNAPQNNNGYQQQQNAPQQQYQQPQNQQPQNNAHWGIGQTPVVNMPQQNYQRMDEDPFANSKGPIEVSEDDLPF